MVLKLLIFAPSGASVQRRRPSRPRKLAASANWDYRFLLELRDSNFVIDALLSLAATTSSGRFSGGSCRPPR